APRRREKARRMNGSKAYSPAWLTAAAVVFVGDIFLHLPITDFCDALVKRFGFLPFDFAVRRGFLVIAVLCLGGVWVWPSGKRAAIGAATVVLMAVVVAAQMLIVLNGIEDVH